MIQVLKKYHLTKDSEGTFKLVILSPAKSLKFIVHKPFKLVIRRVSTIKYNDCTGNTWIGHIYDESQERNQMTIREHPDSYGEPRKRPYPIYES